MLLIYLKKGTNNFLFTIDDTILNQVALRYVYKNYTADRPIDLCTVPVEYPAKPAEKQSIGLCVSALYHPMTKNTNLLDPISVIEWLEMQKILGVGHFSIYIHSVHVSILRVLQYYARLGVVSLRSMGPINDDMYKMPRTTSILDCLYRYMYTHRKVLTLDFDQIIVPRDHVSLVDMMSAAAKKDHVKTQGTHFQFLNNMVYTDHPSADLTKSENTKFLRYRHYQVPDPFAGYGKSIHDPQTCTFPSTHMCVQMATNATVVQVNASMALSYHFKDCSTVGTHDHCAKAFESSTHNDMMLRYESILGPNVEETLKNLPLLDGA